MCLCVCVVMWIACINLVFNVFNVLLVFRGWFFFQLIGCSLPRSQLSPPPTPNLALGSRYDRTRETCVHARWTRWVGEGTRIPKEKTAVSANLSLSLSPI